MSKKQENVPYSFEFQQDTLFKQDKFIASKVAVLINFNQFASPVVKQSNFLAHLFLFGSFQDCRH